MASDMRANGRRPGRIPASDLPEHDANLVRAAAKLFRKHGYGGTSIDMLAAEAKASPKTIYSRYGDKIGLFAAVVEQMVSSALVHWEDLDVGADPRQELCRAANRFLATVLSRDVLTLERAVICEAARFPELARVFYKRGPERGLDVLSSYFAEQHNRGKMQVEDSRAAAELFVSMLEGELVRRALLLEQEPSERERKSWVAFVVAGLLKICSPEITEEAAKKINLR